MKRILFCVLWLIPFLLPQAWGDIEIYVNGHKYDSIEAYKASQKALPAKPVLTPDALNSQQQNLIRQQAQQLGIKVDVNKIKTLKIDQDSISPSTIHKFYVLSVENGVVSALQDFYQAWGQADLQTPQSISTGQLEGVIQQAVSASKDPKLLISEPGKVRIMSLTPDKSSK